MLLGIAIYGLFIVFGFLFLFFFWASGEETPRENEQTEDSSPESTTTE
ncbi:MAG: hypothetical protein V1915_03720 [Candidatus Bathyarchaeota archaeon]